MPVCLSPFLWIRTILAFFHSKGNLPVRKQSLKIMFRGLQTESPHIFNNEYYFYHNHELYLGLGYWLFEVCPHMQSDKKIMHYHSAIGNSEGNKLPFEIGEHWSAKKRIENLTFFLKANNIFITMKWRRNAGNFLSF